MGLLNYVQFNFFSSLLFSSLLFSSLLFSSLLFSSLLTSLFITFCSFFSLLSPFFFLVSHYWGEFDIASHTLQQVPPPHNRCTCSPVIGLHPAQAPAKPPEHLRYINESITNKLRKYLQDNTNTHRITSEHVYPAHSVSSFVHAQNLPTDKTNIT